MSTPIETRTVVAVSDPVPMEGGGGFIESTPTPVPNTWYYRRQISDGSLREVAAESETTPANTAGPTAESAPAATTKKGNA